MNVKVTIAHDGKENDYMLRRGLGFQALCEKFQTPIEFDCREADCGICIVDVAEGATNLSPPTEREADFLKAMRAKPTERLSCQARVFGPVTVVVDDY